MEDPGIVVAVLKVGLLMVMGGATIAIFREIVSMARGRPASRPETEKKES